MWLAFFEAIANGDLEAISLITASNPELDINYQILGGWTALHTACWRGHGNIVSFLLGCPNIDVNCQTHVDETPFAVACIKGCVSCVRLLLDDPRVNVNERDFDEEEEASSPPLWHAAFGGHLDVIRWWIASGREMDLGVRDEEDTDAISIALQRGHKECQSLLEKFEEDPRKTRYLVRIELGCFVEAAREMYALVVFVSDGLLRIKDNNSTIVARFFQMTCLLPLELQMVMCLRLVGSSKTLIKSEHSEFAFKDLAKLLGVP